MTRPDAGADAALNPGPEARAGEWLATTRAP
jgi:hypothetical protein